MKNTIKEIIEGWKSGKEEPVLVSDGAMGTLLMSLGLPEGSCPELWNSSNPASIASIHEKYFAAGADLVETNTFGGNRLRLEHFGLGDRVSELNRRAVEIARSVCPQGKFVAASVGPTGELMEPFGRLTESLALEVFTEQVEALIQAGVDLVIVETMMDINEILAAVKAARQVDSDIPLVATMTFEENPAGYATSMGIDPAAAVSNLSGSGADVFGANCGRGVDEMIGIMKAFRKETDMPLLAQANAGIPKVEEGKLVYPETPQERGEAARTLMELKVNIIGGCCGTGPDHIRAIREAVGPRTD